MIRHQFEVSEHRIVRIGSQLVEEKLQYLQAGLDVQVESAVDEFEQPRTARVQRFHLCQEVVERERPRGLVQRRQTEFTFERTAARGLYVQRAMGDVVVAV